jgi:hypothetical protein
MEVYISRPFRPWRSNLHLRSEASANKMTAIHNSGKSVSGIFFLEVSMFRIMRIFVVASFLMGMASAVQAQAPERVKIDLSKLGPQVGEQVPDFSLKDQAGSTWTRSSITGTRGTMLVFVRSAEW